MFGAEILPEIARFDAFDTARQHTMFDGCPQKTSIPLKSQKHILAYHNFKCQWIGLNIFMTIKGSKIYLILKSGADGNSIIHTQFYLECYTTRGSIILHWFQITLISSGINHDSNIWCTFQISNMISILDAYIHKHLVGGYLML